MAERFQRMCNRALRSLTELRRRPLAVRVQNAGQVNIGEQQVNVGGQAAYGARRWGHLTGSSCTALEGLGGRHFGKGYSVACALFLPGRGAKGVQEFAPRRARLPALPWPVRPPLTRVEQSRTAARTQA